MNLAGDREGQLHCMNCFCWISEPQFAKPFIFIGWLLSIPCTGEKKISSSFMLKIVFNEKMGWGSRVSLNVRLWSGAPVLNSEYYLSFIGCHIGFNILHFSVTKVKNARTRYNSRCCELQAAPTILCVFVM
jgi:hypothetical protein